jgi:hypothetical protein
LTQSGNFENLLESNQTLHQKREFDPHGLIYMCTNLK